MNTRWYESNTGNHQGLVIEEETGRNIAVTYEKEDAGLVASAPDLLEACQKGLELIMDVAEELMKTKEGLNIIQTLAKKSIHTGNPYGKGSTVDKMKQAIAKATQN